MIDEKEFKLLKKMVVELTKNSLVMQKNIIKTREENADNLKRMKELAAVTFTAIDNIERYLGKGISTRAG